MILNVTLTKKSIKVVTCTIIVKLLHARAHEIGGVGSVMKPQVNNINKVLVWANSRVYLLLQIKSNLRCLHIS